MRTREEHAEDLQAELGYREAGAKEVALREWYSLVGSSDEPAPTPKAFTKLVHRLYNQKWREANPEAQRAIWNRYRKTPEAKKRRSRTQHEATVARQRAAARAHKCAQCGAEWCRVPGTYHGGRVPKFCTQKCQDRFWFLENRRRRGKRKR